MKKNKAISIVTTTVILVILFAFNTGADEKRYSLTVTAYGLRNNGGVVQFALYNKDGTIPDPQYKKYYKKSVAQIKNGRATVVFKSLSKGRYAVNILHDENRDGQIEKKFIKPTEGIGFTNYKSIGLTNRPKFSKASFLLDKNLKKTVKTIYL